MTAKLIASSLSLVRHLLFKIIIKGAIVIVCHIFGKQLNVLSAAYFVSEQFCCDIYRIHLTTCLIMFLDPNLLRLIASFYFVSGVDSRFNIGCRNALEAVLPGITQFNSQSTKLRLYLMFFHYFLYLMLDSNYFLRVCGIR